jgi:hypothetical protein
MVMLQSIDEEGCSHQEYRNYRIWWLAATKGVEFISADLEWEDEECKWGGSWMNIEELRRWVMEEIAYMTPGGQIPSRLRMARNHFDPTPEEMAEIIKQYFKYPEGMKDLAKRWWKIVKERSLSTQDLAEELDRLRKEAGNDKEGTTNIRRTAGRNQQESLLMDPRMDWITKQEPRKLTQVGKLFQTAGLQVPRKLKEVLTEAFTTTQDGKSCYWESKELKEFRLVTKEKWQEWNKLVRSRFKEEDLCDEEERTTRLKLTMGETIEMLRSVKKGNTNWRQEVESWIPRLQQENIDAMRESRDLRLQHAKPRLKAPRRLRLKCLRIDQWMTQ